MVNKRLVFIINIPNQYRIPLFNELHQQLNKRGIQLFVIFGSSGYNKRKSVVNLSDCKFEYKVLKSKFLNGIEKKTGFMFYSGLIRTIKELKPNEIIVTGYALSTMKLLLYNNFRSNSYFIFSGSVQPPNSNSGYFRNLQRKFLIKKAKGFIAYGSYAKKYIVKLGGMPSKITIMGNTVDTIFFKNETDKLRAELKETVKNHLLYLGYINQRKKVEDLVYVAKELLKFRTDFVIDIIGDGEGMNSLKQLIDSQDLDNYFTLHGFKQKEELPLYLARSKCFLFQTSFDIWGLVLNEAMAAGVPCLASINAGSTEDLIEESVTGFKVDFANYEYVAQKIDWLLNNPAESRMIGMQASRFISLNYTASNAAANIIKAVNI